MFTSIAGKRSYEVVNWLGSVLAVVRDMKYLHSEAATGTVYSSSFEGGDENMFRSSFDAHYSSTENESVLGTKSLVLSPQVGQQWGDFGPNIRELVKAGNTVKIDVQTLWKSSDGSANRGGGVVYEFVDENGKRLYNSQNQEQWFELTVNDEEGHWSSRSTGTITVPVLFNQDGTQYSFNKSTLVVYPWVANGLNKTYFDDLKVSINRSNETEEYFMAVIEESHDYGDFGVMLAGRGFSGDGSDNGWGGMKKDDEIAGSGAVYMTEYRENDVRLGRWFSVDPLFYKYPYITPYSSMHNNPINITDKLGLGPNSITVTYQGQSYEFEQILSQEEKSNLPSSGWFSETATPIRTASGTVSSSYFDKNGKLLYVEIAGVKYKIKGSIVPPSKIKENVETTSTKTEKIEEAKPAQDKKDETISETKKTEDTKKPDKVKTEGVVKKKEKKKDEKPKGELKEVTKDPKPKLVPKASDLSYLNIAFDGNEDEFDSPTSSAYGSDPLDEDLKDVIATLRKNKSNFVRIQVSTAYANYTDEVPDYGTARALLEARKRAVMAEFTRLAPDVVKNGQVQVFYDASSLSNAVGFKGSLTEYVEEKK